MANASLIEEIRKHVESECRKERNLFGMRAYTEHIVIVVGLAEKLAIATNADSEIVAISSWFHDIGSIIGDYENHHISGADYAERFLEERDYPRERIARIKHCIYAHRGSKSIPRETIEAKCVADADALAHFTDIPSLFYLAYATKKLRKEQGVDFMRKKLERTWNKISLEQAKEMAKAKYEAAMLLLSPDS